ncbi:uncharacterized protein LOC110451397 isoform X2 [Mizuhopecten yessoensis]|nr:uncharacterized protein LOC110451397 isoform X2 [Mizuhopecten yessoensis]
MASNQDIPEEADGIHNKMVYYLGEQINDDHLCKLKGLFKNIPLTPVDIDQIHDISGLFNRLMEKEVIGIGNYTKLISNLQPINPKLATYVKQKEKEIINVDEWKLLNPMIRIPLLKMAEGCDLAESCNSKLFVERKEPMDWLNKMYNERQRTANLPENHQYRIYGIHGKKGIGKSCVMLQFLHRIQHETSRNETVHVGSFDFDKVRSFQSFLNRLCTFFGVEMHKWKKESGNNNDDDEEEEEDFMDCMSQIERKMTDNPSNKFIVFLDNMECACGKAKTDGTAPDMSNVFLWDKIYKEFIHNLLPKCHNLLVFITSTQTARFAEFGSIACKKDLKEMTEEEAECLLRNQVPRVITEKGSLSSIVRLCDGLPPTIIKAGAMLCDEDYKHEEIANLLKDFNNKMDLHGDDLFPKDDRYDEQLKKFINRLSDQNKSNLKSLAEMINTQGQVGIEDAASKLQFESNTAEFKLKILFPLWFRGMVEVDTKTRKISMNTFICQFVLSYDIKGNVGKEDVVRPPCGYSPTSGGRISPHGHSTNPSDDHANETLVKLPPLGKDLAICIAPSTEKRTVLSVHHETSSTPNGSSNTEKHSQLTDDVEAALDQEGTGIFDSVLRVCRETFQIFKEIES